MITEPIYQVIVLGWGASVHEAAVRDLIEQRARDISDDVANSIRFHRATSARELVVNAPVVCVYLGGDRVADEELVEQLRTSGIPIIPIVSSLKNYASETPKALCAVNGCEVDWASPDFTEIANLVLENLALLRRERRLFISYFRKESEDAAHQLRVALDDAGYDTFLDVSSVPKGDDFQAVLWHRLLDSDVMILLDTPNFLTSRWTQEEVAKASAMSVGILRIAWPGVVGERFAELAAHLLLEDGDLLPSKRLSDGAVVRIVRAAEGLRARNVAARHDNLVGEFCEAAKGAGLPYAVQPARFVLGWKADGKRVAALPAVGVPDAQRFHDAARRFPVAGETADEAVLLYDHRGMHDAWTEYLGWLDQYLPVKGLRVINTAAFLKGTP